MIKHKIIKKSSANISFEVDLDKQYIEPVKAKVLNKLKANIKVAGFREGNIPDNIAEREIGDTRMQTEVLEELINQSYIKVVEELKLEVIAHPKVQIQKFVPYTQMGYLAEVAIMPSINFDYKKIRIKKQTAKIDKEEIDKTIESLRWQLAKKDKVDRAAKKGDELRIDFEGKREGKPVEGAGAQNQIIVIGNDQFIPGFETNLIGLKSNDEKEFTISFPKDYSRKDLASKKVDFKVKVHEVKEVILPKLDDDFAKKVGDFKNLTDLREDISLKLKENQQNQIDRQYEHQIIEQIVSKIKLELPEILVEQQLAKLRSEVEQNLKNSGLDMKKYLELNNKSQNQLDEELKKEADKRVAVALILRDVIEKEKIKISDNELKKEMDKLKLMHRGSDNEKKLDDKNFVMELKNHMLSEKAIKTLINYALGGKK